jgi:hypothetical protein
MIEQAFRAALLRSDAVRRLLAARVYPVVLPQAPQYPAATYQMVSNWSEYSHDGASRFADSRIQVDLYATTHGEVAALRNAVMGALSGAKGGFGEPTVRIQGVFRVMELDAYEAALETAGPRVWRKTLDFRVIFEEDYCNV